MPITGKPTVKRLVLLTYHVQTHTGEFDVICALKELFVYAVKYHSEVTDSLQTDPQLVKKFANLIDYKF